MQMHKPTGEVSAHILRELPQEQAFYFYREVDAPIGKSAFCLTGFIDSVKTVELVSLEFHMGRGDFEKWVTLLGDETLSRQIANLRLGDLKGENMRKRLLQIMRLRQGYLRNLAKAQTT
jgi:hypothetical protein